LRATRDELAAAGLSKAGAPSATTVEAATNSPEPTPTTLAARVGALEESAQLVEGKLDEQHQTKVESASKYRVRLSGIVLLNLFSNHGVPDNQDFPEYADVKSPYDSNNSFGATMRQSEIGLEAFGPRIAGARTSATLQADFAGGFPYTSNGVN